MALAPPQGRAEWQGEPLTVPEHVDAAAVAERDLQAGAAEHRHVGTHAGAFDHALVWFLVVDAALLAFRLFAVVDAWRVGTARSTLLTGLAVLAALTAAPHVAAA